MYPESDPCYACLCQKDFDNSSIATNNNCQKINCGIQLNSLHYIQKGCIPIYLKDKACCPIDWKCRMYNLTIFFFKIIDKTTLLIYS
jgi:hypothetical protein